MILDIEMLRSFYASYSDSVKNKPRLQSNDLSLMLRRYSLLTYMIPLSCDHIKEV